MYRIMNIDKSRVPRNLWIEDTIRQMRRNLDVDDDKRQEAEGYLVEKNSYSEFCMNHRRIKNCNEERMRRIWSDTSNVVYEYILTTLSIDFPRDLLERYFENGGSSNTVLNVVDILYTGNGDVFRYENEEAWSVQDKIMNMVSELNENNDMADILEAAIDIVSHIEIEDIGVKLKDVFDALFLLPDEEQLIIDVLQDLHQRWFENVDDEDLNRGLYKESFWRSVVVNVFGRLEQTLEHDQQNQIIEEYYEKVNDLNQTALLQVDISIQILPEHIQNLYSEIQSRISMVEKKGETTTYEKGKKVCHYVATNLSCYLDEIDKLFVSNDVLYEEQLEEFKEQLR